MAFQKAFLSAKSFDEHGPGPLISVLSLDIQFLSTFRMFITLSNHWLIDVSLFETSKNHLMANSNISSAFAIILKAKYLELVCSYDVASNGTISGTYKVNGWSC